MGEKKVLCVLLTLLTASIVCLNGSSGLNKSYKHLDKTFDVVVVGSDPEGISAAISSSRNGLKTLLLDTRDRVGGLYTLGWLNTIDMNYKKKGTREVVNKGIFEEFFKKLGNRVAFDIPTAQKVFENMLKEAEVDVLLNVTNIKPIVEDNVIKGILFSKEGEVYKVSADVYIDSTPNADIAAMSGVPYKVGREDLGMPDKFAASTLVFSVKNVNWERVKEYLNKDDNPYTGAKEYSAWGYSVMFDAPIDDPNIQVRGLNIGRQDDGSVVINALQIFNVNPFDQDERHEAINQAKKTLPKIIKYMNKHCPGFENAVLTGVADELYIRESRHIIGEYTLTVDDVFENRNQDIAVAFGSYPIDLQATQKDHRGCALNGTNPYGIPFGVILPKKINNLLVVNKCASYDSISFGSARTVPVGMALGQAAGVASKLKIDQNISFRKLAHDKKLIFKMRKLLTNQGVDLKAIKVIKPEMKSWAYPYIKRLRKRALVSKGYYNSYRLKDQATALTFKRIFTLVNYNSPLTIDLSILKNFKVNEPIDKKDYLYIVNKILKKEYRNFKELLDDNLVDNNAYKHIYNKKSLTNEDAYALADGLLSFLFKKEGFHY